MPEIALLTTAGLVKFAVRSQRAPAPAAVNISGRWHWHLRERERVFLSLDQTDASITGHYNENVCGNDSTFGSLTGYVSGNVVVLELEGFGAFSGTKYATHRTMTGTLNGQAITFHEHAQDD